VRCSSRDNGATNGTDLYRDDIRDRLFDHLVSLQQNRLRHSKAERLGGLEVYRHLEFDWQLNWKVGRLRATENAIDVGGGATVYKQPEGGP
jgi:hypothetical protein